jgi:hypothetical protein
MSGPQQASGRARDKQDSGQAHPRPNSPTNSQDLQTHGLGTPPAPVAPDTLEPDAGDVSTGVSAPYYGPSDTGGRSSPEPFVDALPLGTAVPFSGDPTEWLRLEVRHLIREFLSVVPRNQGSVILTFPRPDGTPRTLSRAELSAAIDRMRPRQKQIIRLVVEERRPQEEVCALLNGISLRTLQRDQAEALDLLAQL